MEHYDEGLTSLRLLQRTPSDVEQPLPRMRIHVRCSDCVAGIDVDADSWGGFARLFNHDFNDFESAAWIAPAGEWKLQVENGDDSVYSITSEIE